MKKKLLVLLVPLALAVTGPVAAQAAATTRVPAPFDFPHPGKCFTGPGVPKAFDYSIKAVVNNEWLTETTNAAGDVTDSITGRLVVSFTNLTTGKAIVMNVSGPTTEIDKVDGSGTKVGTGNNWWGFGPKGQRPPPLGTGQPGLVFTSGKAVVTFANGTATSFSLNGHLENGCALLS